MEAVTGGRFRRKGTDHEVDHRKLDAGLNASLSAQSTKGMTVIFMNTTSLYAVPNDGHTLPPDNIRTSSHFRGEMTLDMRLITQSEIAQRQLQVRTDAHRARHAFTLSGVRQLIGNTFIALGMRMHGENESRRIEAPRRTSVPAHGV